MYYLISPFKCNWGGKPAIATETFQELKEQLPTFLEKKFKAYPKFKDKVLPGLDIVKYENFDYYLSLPLKKIDYRDPEARKEEFKGKYFPRQSRIDSVLAGLIYCVIRGYTDTFKRICTFNWPLSWKRFVQGKSQDECFWGDLKRKERKKIIAERRAAAHNITLNDNILNPISE